MTTSTLMPRVPARHRAVLMVSALLVTLVLLTLLAWAALEVQVTAAGMLNGESLWSKAQTRAIVDLYAYAGDGDATHLAAFRRHYDRLLDSHRARRALLAPVARWADARQALTHAGIEPGAITGMMLIIRYFNDAPYIAPAMRWWRQADRQLAVLPQIADRLHTLHARGDVDQQTIRHLGERVLDVDADVAPLAREFSRSIVSASTALARIVFAIIAAIASLLLLVWGLVLRALWIRLRTARQHARILFEQRGDGVLVSAAGNGRIVAANAAAQQLLGRGPDVLTGMALADLLGHGGPADGRSRVDIDGAMRELDVRSHAVKAGRRRLHLTVLRAIDGSSPPRHGIDTARAVMQHMREGVMVTDAEGTILEVNPAQTRISGFDAREVIGRCLQDGRLTREGVPLDHTDAETWLRDGWTGCVQARRKDGSYYPERLTIVAIERDTEPQADQRYVALTDSLSDALALRRERSHLLNHDALTGLVNRPAFEDACDRTLADAGASGRASSILFVDIDGFKAINDAMGRAVGDHFLVHVAERLRRLVGGSDAIARIGGDEFTLRIDNADPIVTAARVLEQLAEPVELEGRELRFSASIGIATYPDHGHSAPELIAHADAAMHAAKHGGRNGYRVYNPQMPTHAHELYGLAGDLRQALARGQFSLLFQPTHEMDSGRVIGMETLLRWHHPERGDIEPSEFIPVAERTGLIHDIGRWVMGEACRHAVDWCRTDCLPMRLAVNVSARTFAHPGFVDSVRDALQESGLPAGRLVLEITESAILNLGERTHRALEELHALGVSLAIDDFGTGYSSLTYLKLPGIAQLKIDRSFVAGVPERSEDCAIAEAVLALARALDLSAVAEGVETEAQRHFLRGVGCAVAQGFLFSRPMPAAAITALLAEQAASR